MLILKYDAVICKKMGCTKVEERCSPIHIPKTYEEDGMRAKQFTRKKVLLIEFMNWPIEKRQKFIEKEMPDSSQFITDMLLRSI